MKLQSLKFHYLENSKEGTNFEKLFLMPIPKPDTRLETKIDKMITNSCYSIENVTLPLPHTHTIGKQTGIFKNMMAI